MTFHHAKKSLGQNFLVNEKYQQRIDDCFFKDYQNETVIEIGPGHGALTGHLVDRVKKLVLIEKDDILSWRLMTKYKDHPTVQVMHADFLKLNLDELFKSLDIGPGAKAVVIGNLPYNVATDIFLTLIRQGNFLNRLYLMFQKEVVDKMRAKPGDDGYGALSAAAQTFCKISPLLDLSPKAFSPKPKVTSSFARFEINTESTPELNAFLKFVKMVFLKRRKKLSNILKPQIAALPDDKAAKVLKWHNCRPEELKLSELKELFELIR